MLGSCDEADLSSNWAELMSQDTSNDLSYRNSWNYINNYSGDRAKLDAFHDDFMANSSAGSGFAVSQVTNSSNHDGQSVTIYTFDPSSVFNIVEDSGFGTGFLLTNNLSVKFLTLGFNAGAGCRLQVEEYGFSGSNAIPSYDRIPNFFTASSNIEYPVDYSGDSISSAPGGVVTGNVQCANTNNIISAIQVNVQSGLDGNATITDDSNGGKNYSYYLAEENPYSLIVICDGDPFYSPTVNADLYDHYDWVCVPTTPGQDPNMNICAAS